MTTRGVVTLVFDDGYRHILEDIVPILDDLNIPGVFAIPIDNQKIAHQTKFPIASLYDWQTHLRNSIHELAAHSISHSDLNTLTSQDLEFELSTPAKKLPATTLIYPGGAHNDTVVNEAKKYYKAARTVQRGINAIPPTDAMRLKTYNFTQNNFSVTKANALALYAYLTNSWLIETYHIISDTDSTSTHAISFSDFKKHIAFLSKLPLNKKTISDVIVTL